MKAVAPTKDEMVKAQMHADADQACGRWQCACGACSTCRDFGWKPKQERGKLALPFGGIR